MVRTSSPRYSTTPSVLRFWLCWATTEKRAIAGEPEGPRIVLPGGWLQASDITDHQIEEDRWVAQPRTLALLMACESAAMESDSLNDFVLAFASAGAAAVVGTEVNTFSGIAAEFALEVTAMVWLNRGTQIGEAIRRFRLALASGRNPLGFVFTAYGIGRPVDQRLR